MIVYAETGLDVFNELLGATIEEVAVSKDGETTLRFTTDRGVLHIGTEGDCCSESWWADILGVRDIIGGEVVRVEELALPKAIPDERSRQESDIQYGYAITTTLGAASFIFRNSSNGYYGGWCARGFGDRYTSGCEWQVIDTNDWQA